MWLASVSLQVPATVWGWNFALSPDPSLNLGKSMRVSQFFQKSYSMERFSFFFSSLSQFFICIWSLLRGVRPSLQVLQFHCLTSSIWHDRSLKKTLHPSSWRSKYCHRPFCSRETGSHPLWHSYSIQDTKHADIKQREFNSKADFFSRYSVKNLYAIYSISNRLKPLSTNLEICALYKTPRLANSSID